MPAPPDILVEIVRRRRGRLGVTLADTVPIGADAGSRDGTSGTVDRRLPVDHPFLAALAGPAPSIIAEIKMGSPRIGSLADRVDPEVQAALYRDEGAAALSVVVEPDFFGGSYDLLGRCRRVSRLPAIAKDFVVSLEQLDKAAAAGADAILLIASLYSAQELLAWASRARARGLVPLVETHGAGDRESLSGGEWELVGVNNRDLRTFDVDLETSIAAIPELPAGCLKVSESGIESGADVARLAAAGFDAFLVGESLLLAEDPAARLRELVEARP